MTSRVRYPLEVMPSSSVAWGRHICDWRNCQRCTIGVLAHEHVFARGQIPCDVLFLGEGPGRSEDVIGKPFVGRAGDLLTKWIEHARAARFNNANRDAKLAALFKPEYDSSAASFRYAITNTVLCRPTDSVGGPNRQPSDEEVANCDGRLREFVRIARPKAVVMLGRVPAKVWAMSSWTRALKLPCLKLLHPAAILHNGDEDSPKDMREREKLAVFIKEILDADKSAQ